MTFETTRLLVAVIALNEENQPGGNPDAHRDLDSGTIQDSGPSHLMARRIGPGDLLSAPVPLAVPGGRATPDAPLDQSIELHIIQAGDATGLALWIDRGPDGRSIGHSSSATDSKAPVGDHRHVVFSWPANVKLSSGDNVKLNLRAGRLSEDSDWSWDSLIRKVESGKTKRLDFSRMRPNNP